MKKILQYLFEHKTLSREQAKDVLVRIAKGEFNESELAAFITVFLMRSVKIEELQGFRDALLELCVRVDLDGQETIDIVGTGGGGEKNFNNSPLACFIVAGMGDKVAKNRNYGGDGMSGGSKSMEQAAYHHKDRSGNV